jgi:AAA ATPase domain
MSGALVLRGEPGVGKSALLGDVMEHAGDLQIVRTVAVESEMTLAFAAVHQLLSPLLPGTNRLPEPQRRALSVAFGLVSGPPADPFLVGLAALTLFADAADARPVLCLVDDAQWLDDESADVLTFVARRLLADGVGMVVALRETTEPDPRLQALPGLRVAGLPEPDAYELLQTSISRPIDAGAAARTVVETGGNPLAVVEAARELAPEQLGGLEPLPDSLPVGRQLEDRFVRRVRGLPADTQRLLLLAAADQPGRAARLTARPRYEAAGRAAWLDGRWPGTAREMIMKADRKAGRREGAHASRGRPQSVPGVRAVRLSRARCF